MTRPTLRPARLALLVMAVGQLVSPLFLYLGNRSLETGGPGEAPIVPAGYTFSIWAVICAFGIAYAVWQMVAFRAGGPDAKLLDELAWPLTGVFSGYSIWLVFALFGPTWITVVIFAAMLGLLIRALWLARAARSRIATWSRTGRVLLWGLVGTYAGWTSVAVWINLTTVLVDAGAPVTGTAGILGQLGVLAAATATACAVAWRTDGLLPAAGAAAWALLGAIVRAVPESPLLGATAAGGLLVLIAVTAAGRRRAATSSAAR